MASFAPATVTVSPRNDLMSSLALGLQERRSPAFALAADAAAGPARSVSSALGSDETRLRQQTLDRMFVSTTGVGGDSPEQERSESWDWVAVGVEGGEAVEAEE